MERHLSVIFCDDVRIEVGNKFSFMGVYTGDYVIQGATAGVPIAIPRLCVYATISTPLERPLRQFSLKVEHEGRVIMESGDLAPQPGAEDGAADPERAELFPISRQLVAVNFVVSPFIVSRPSAVIVTATADNEPFDPWALRVRFTATDAAPESVVERTIVP